MYSCLTKSTVKRLKVSINENLISILSMFHLNLTDVRAKGSQNAGSVIRLQNHKHSLHNKWKSLTPKQPVVLIQHLPLRIPDSFIFEAS